MCYSEFLGIEDLVRGLIVGEVLGGGGGLLG
jgi:hypothetical protein